MHLYIWSHRGEAISMGIFGYRSVKLPNYIRCVGSKKLLSDACENDNQYQNQNQNMFIAIKVQQSVR